MYLQRQLAKEFPSAIRARGGDLHRYGSVTLVSGNQWQAAATVRGSRIYHVLLSRQGDEIHVLCDCPYFNSDGPCKHLWATILASDEKCYLLGAMGGGRLQLVEDPGPDQFDDDFDEDDEREELEVEFPRRVFGQTYRRPPPPPPKPKIPQWRSLLQQVKDAPTSGSTPDAWRADRDVYYILDHESTLSSRVLCLKI